MKTENNKMYNKIYTKAELMAMDLDVLKTYWRAIHDYAQDLTKIIDFREL